MKRRRREWEERPSAMNQFGQCLQLAQKAVDSFKVIYALLIHGEKVEVSLADTIIYKFLERTNEGTNESMNYFMYRSMNQ